MNSAGTEVVNYTYNAWGLIINASGSLVSTLGYANPFRYRGYYYDTETGYYYLNSRYYDPTTGRFLNADNRISGAGGDIRGYNLFSYCFNNPVNMSDPAGNWPKWIEDLANWVNDNIIQPVINYVNDNYVKHDVPLYDQGKTRLCWAYCQMMVEDYQNGTTSVQSEVDKRARQLAEQENGKTNWNSGDWPTNLGEKINVSQITNIKALHSKLKQGPLYAYYNNPQVKGGAHLVVVTGVNCFTGEVYTNNPQRIFGKQSFDEFLNMYAGGDDNVPLSCVYTII